MLTYRTVHIMFGDYRVSLQEVSSTETSPPIKYGLSFVVTSRVFEVLRKLFDHSLIIECLLLSIVSAMVRHNRSESEEVKTGSDASRQRINSAVLIAGQSCG